MPDMDGIELANRILDFGENTAVVFVTAYNEYAVEAFRLNAVDFLMKPVEEARLRETLDRIGKEKNIPLRSDSVHVCCFGQFCVETNNGKVKFRTEKAEELFAFLIEQRGNFVSRSMILDRLWEDFDGERALVNFNSTLYNVKKALLAHGIKLPIEYAHGNYRLDMAGLDCDCLKFLELASDSKPVTGPNLPDFETAAKLFKGDYLSGKESLWAERSRQTFRNLYIGLLLRLEEYYRAEKNHGKIIELLKAGLAYEPLHKELNKRLIEALLATDDRVSAERYYELYQNGCKIKLQQKAETDLEKLLNKK
jgi:two-component SAPR family response regulator